MLQKKQHHQKSCEQLPLQTITADAWTTFEMWQKKQKRDFSEAKFLQGASIASGAVDQALI